MTFKRQINITFFRNSNCVFIYLLSNLSTKYLTGIVSILLFIVSFPMLYSLNLIQLLHEFLGSAYPFDQFHLVTTLKSSYELFNSKYSKVFCNLSFFAIENTRINLLNHWNEVMLKKMFLFSYKYLCMKCIELIYFWYDFTYFIGNNGINFNHID